jgi:flagellar assembly factor FliW
MIVENTRFGTIEIKEDKIITMKRDIPGFSGRKRFVLLDREESRPFLWYQCVDDPPLAFILLNPFQLMPDYSLDIKAIFAGMSWSVDDVDNVTIFVIVNASSGVPGKMTANLMAPVIINTDKLEALQVILQDGIYSHKHPLFCDSEGNMDSKKQLAANS